MSGRAPKASRERQRKATRRLFLWLDQVKTDDQLLPIDFTVGYEIAKPVKHKHGGVAWPSTETIAANIGVGKATVIRAVSREPRLLQHAQSFPRAGRSSRRP